MWPSVEIIKLMIIIEAKMGQNRRRSKVYSASSYFKEFLLAIQEIEASRLFQEIGKEYKGNLLSNLFLTLYQGFARDKNNFKYLDFWETLGRHRKMLEHNLAHRLWSKKA